MKKRCPECFLMSERSFYCPCDDFNLFDNENYNILPPNRTSYCKVPMSYCIEQYVDIFLLMDYFFFLSRIFILKKL